MPSNLSIEFDYLLLYSSSEWRRVEDAWLVPKSLRSLVSRPVFVHLFSRHVQPELLQVVCLVEFISFLEKGEKGSVQGAYRDT